MKKMVRLGWIAMCALVLASCSSEEKKAETTSETEVKVEKVRTEPIAKQIVSREIDCTSVLEGYETMNVSPSLTGIIEKIYKEVGDPVSAGELLVRMDQTQLNTAKLTFANLVTEMKRMDALKEGGNVTQQTYDATKLNFDKAKENLDFIQNNTFFKATFQGVVSAKNHENGELFSGSKAILTVTQINMLKTLINIPEAYFPQIKEGMKLNIVSDIYPDMLFPAVIETIYPTIDASTHTFQCKVRIPNGKSKLRPGMYVHTTVPVGKSSALLVPYQSVMKLTGSNERFLFINEGGVARRVKVDLGQRFDKFVEIISSDVEEGQQLVTQGQARLVDGVYLEVINEVSVMDSVKVDSAAVAGK